MPPPGSTQAAVCFTMTSRSSRGRRQRVIDARRQARFAQGRAPDAEDLFSQRRPIYLRKSRSYP